MRYINHLFIVHVHVQYIMQYASALHHCDVQYLMHKLKYCILEKAMLYTAKILQYTWCPCTARPHDDINEYFNSYCNYYSWLQNQNFHTGASAYHNSFHPFPLGSYYNCFGNESSLSDCRSTSSSSCDRNDAARVYCRGDVITGAYVAIACHVYMSDYH